MAGLQHNELAFVNQPSRGPVRVISGHKGARTRMSAIHPKDIVLHSRDVGFGPQAVIPTSRRRRRGRRAAG